MILRAYSTRPWWRPTGITGSDITCVYQPKGAADADAALVNLASPGTNNATYHTTAIRWDKQRGWWNELATDVAAGAVLGPALGANSTFVLCYSMAGQTSTGQWLQKLGGSYTFYFRVISGPSMEIRLGRTPDLISLRGTAQTNILSDHDVYVDGEFFGNISGTVESSGSLLIGNNSTYAASHKGDIWAVAVYNKTLTPNQCKELHLGLLYS